LLGKLRTAQEKGGKKGKKRKKKKKEKKGKEKDLFLFSLFFLNR